MPFFLNMPKLSPTMEVGTLAKWHKKVGEFVEVDELILEIATDKATLEYNALEEGFLRKILAKEGETVKVNDPIAIFTETKEESIENFNVPKVEEIPVIEEKTEEVQKVVVQKNQVHFAPQPPLENYRFKEERLSLKASPLAKKMAKENGLDLTSVKGSGPGGRVIAKDLETAAKSSTLNFNRKELPDVAPGTYEEEPLTPMQKVMGQRLQDAKSFIPHFYVTVTLDVKPLITMREELSAMGIKLSINDFIVRATALALRESPTINSGYHAKNETIVRFKTVDIAIAVSLKEGLITPIVRHADYRSVQEISQEIRSLALRAKEGKLLPEEYQGGSFTISNLGMYGVSAFAAIINPPQAAILAVSAILDAPVLKEGQVVAGKIMHLTLSSDHRVIDGVAAAKFLSLLKKYLQAPSILLL
jgi:pyruvate dehydrogenase E2 component (dihydrolipoamide acetyltransferase)